MNDTPPPAAPPTPVRLALNGPPRLGSDGRWIALERKAAGALAWLALRGPVLRVRLAELLWPSAPPEGARNSLRQLIFKLKRAVETPVIEGQDTLRLAPEVRLDAGDGELLEGCVYDDCPAFAAWLAEARAAQRHDLGAERQRQADAALAAGDAERALELARALVADDELSEAAHLRLVQALYLRGDRRGALQAAEHCVSLLREALAAEPSPALQQLIDTVRRAEAAPAPVAIPVAVLRPPRLVGRGREIAALADARAAGRVALVSGEPGLGKSRLLAEAGAGHPGDRLLGARPGDTAVPYAALARWLRTLHDTMPAALEPLPAALHRLLPERTPAPDGAPRRDLIGAVQQVWQAAARAGLSGVAFDDLHFADEASIEALQVLLDDPALAGLAWTLARRPAEGGPALQRLSDALLDDDRLHPVALEPLDEAGVHELVASLGLPELDPVLLAPELWRRTGGNPLYVLETLKAMWSSPGHGQGLPRPRNVTALIERRLRQLSPAALSLARVAALAGPDFDAPLAVHVLQTPLMSLADAWAELEWAQVLRDQAFAHDLIYEATLDSVPAAIRRHARRAIAEYLTPRDAEPSRIGEHWLAAGEAGLAAPHFVAAGRRAEAAARYAEAREAFERAAACHDQAGQPTQALDTRLALADLLMEARQLDASQQVLDALVPQARTVDARLRVAMQQMHLVSRRDRNADGIQLGQSLLADDELLEEATPQRLAELRWTQAMVLLVDGRAGDALPQLQLAEPVLATTADATWRCWFHSQHAVANSMLGEMGRAGEAQARALDAARQVGRRRMIAGCLQNGATFATAAGHLVESLDLVDECLLLMADAGGDDMFSVYVRSQRGRLLVWLGRYREALELLEPLAGPDSPLDPGSRARAWLALAELWLRLGQGHRARQALERARPTVDSLIEQRVLAITVCEQAWMESGQAGNAVQDFFALAEGGAYRAHAELLQWRERPGHLPAAIAGTQREQWAARGLDGHVVVADALAARDAAAAGDIGPAATWAARAHAGLRRSLLVNVYRPWLHLEIARAAAAADPELAARVLQEGSDWVHNVARFQVPEPFRDSFLQRNRINRELLSLVAAARAGRD